MKEMVHLFTAVENDTILTQDTQLVIAWERKYILSNNLGMKQFMITNKLYS